MATFLRGDPEFGPVVFVGRATKVSTRRGGSGVERPAVVPAPHRIPAPHPPCGHLLPEGEGSGAGDLVYTE